MTSLQANPKIGRDDSRPSQTEVDQATSIERDSDHLQPLKSGSLTIVHWLILGFSFIVTFLAWTYTRSERDARVRTQFEKEAEHVKELIIERMQKYESALQNGVARLEFADNDVTYSQWRHYSNRLGLASKYPGINGIGVIYSLKNENLASFLIEHQCTRPEFDIFPTHSHDEKYIITYICPASENRAAVGLDVAHERNRLDAANQSRDLASAQITGPITLVQDSEKTPGFLFYYPFYRDSQESPPSTWTKDKRRSRFAGMVYAPFIVKKLMDGTLEKEKRHVGIRLQDGDHVLYDEHNDGEADFDPSPMVSQTSAIDIYGRKWTFDIRSTLSFREAANDNHPIVILVCGILIDSLLILLFVALSRTSQRATQLAKKLTAKNKRKTNQLNFEIKEKTTAFSMLEDSNRSLKESETKIRGLFEQSFNFVGLLSTDGKLIDINKTASDHFALKKREILGGFFWDIPNLVDSSIQSAGVKQSVLDAAKGKTIRLETCGKNAQNEPVNMDFSFKPICNDEGKTVFVAAEGRDVSDQKLLEQEMNDVLETLRRSNRDLEQFAYIASHDLQEPLRKISAYGQLLEEEAGNQFDEDARDYLKIMVDGAERMKQLVKDLLSFSKVSREAGNPVSVNLGSCLDDAIHDLDLAINDSEASLDISGFDKNAIVSGKKSQLTQVLRNVIGNAIKYRGKEPLRIIVTSEDTDNGIMVRIRDNGIGFDPKFADRIFEVFQRLHNRRAYSGTGIGLAICKRIIEHFGGHIGAESFPGQGSEFFFSLIKISTDEKTVKQEPTREFNPIVSPTDGPTIVDSVSSVSISD